MTPPKTRIIKTFAKSPYYELIYRTVLWAVVGWYISTKLIYSLSDELFYNELNAYIASIKNWDQIAVIALIAASVVYAIRSLEYFFTARYRNKLAVFATELFSLFAKISSDIALGVFGAGIVIFVTLARAPTRLEGDASAYAAFAGVMIFFSVILVVLAVCYLVGRLGDTSWLYKWQKSRWWSAVLLSPGVVLFFVLYYVYVL